METLSFSSQTWFAAVAIALVPFAVQFAALKLIERSAVSPIVIRRYAIALLCVGVGTQFINAYADATAQRSLLMAVRAIPWAQPLTAKSFLARFGFAVTRAESAELAQQHARRIQLSARAVAMHRRIETERADDRGRFVALRHAERRRHAADVGLGSHRHALRASLQHRQRHALRHFRADVRITRRLLARRPRRTTRTGADRRARRPRLSVLRVRFGAARQPRVPPHRVHAHLGSRGSARARRRRGTRSRDHARPHRLDTNPRSRTPVLRLPVPRRAARICTPARHRVTVRAAPRIDQLRRARQRLRTDAIPESLQDLCVIRRRSRRLGAAGHR